MRPFHRLLCLLLGLGVFVSNLFAGAPPLKSACEVDYPPFCFRDAHGKASGFSIELMKAALRAMGRKVQFRIAPWPQVRGWLEKGEVEVLPLVGRTPEREKLFDFTVPYLSLHGAIVVRQDAKDVVDLDDLKGRQVAVLQGDNADEFLVREDRGIEIHRRSSFLVALRELSAGQHDAVLIPRLVALRLINEAGIANLRVIETPVEGFRQEFCFAVPEGERDTLALLNEGLAVVIADGTHRHLHARWFAALELPRKRAIVVGVDRAFPPYEYLDDEGKVTGYNVDLVRAVARENGLKIELRAEPWSRLRKGLERGAVDLLAGLFYSTERDLHYEFSPAHSLVHYVVVARRGGLAPPSTFEGLAGHRVVVQEGDIAEEALREGGGQAKVIAVADQACALRELVEGKHDFALVARLTALHCMERHRWEDLLVVGQHPLLSPKYCFASAGSRKALVAQFGEGLRVLERKGGLQGLREKWFGLAAQEEPALLLALRASLRVILPLIVILIFALAWTWSLRREVERRTRRLQRSEEFQRAMIACSPVALYACDLEGRVIAWNDSAERVFGWKADEVMGKRLPIVPPDKVDEVKGLVRRIIEEGAFNGVELERLRKGGEPFPVSLSASAIRDGNGEIVGVMGSVVDLSERNRRRAERASLQEQLLQSQKMESIGRLAGGIAHDFNNMLSVIIGYTELCLSEVAGNASLEHQLGEVLSAARRSAAVTRQLLGFARKQTISPVDLNLNVNVERTLTMLERLIGEEIELVWRPCEELWSVKIDATQLDQILTNLCVNGRDAIGGSGRITLETANVQFDEAYCKVHSQFDPGDYVMLAVSDDGRGMDEETRKMVFEPFFTTKGVGEGTGLGLATVYGIVTQNGGHVEVYSEPDHGSTFKLYFPRSLGEVDGQGMAPKVLVPSVRGELILLVEDEVANLRLGCQILERFGYRVLMAETVHRALELVEKGEKDIDLLVTDVVMPGMDGRQLADRIRELVPEMPVLFMSGYTENVIAHRGVLDEGVNFVAKPLTVANLVEAVQRALADSPRARKPAAPS